MLTKKPYFTYRIETKGALYESKINGILLEEDFEANTLNLEQPVNQFMFSGKNIIGFQIYPFEDGGFGAANITISLYVNQDGASEDQKRLLSQVTFKSSDLIKKSEPQPAIKSSMPAVRLDSTNNFLSSKDGDVIISSPKIEASRAQKGAFFVYQHIELITPFPKWSFLEADKLNFPDSWEEFTNNPDTYIDNLITPLYKEHEILLELLKTKDFDKILPLFAERNKEYDIALYYPEGTYEEKLKKALQSDFDDKNSTLILDEFDYAQPTISDDKKLVKLGASAMIKFENEEHSLYSKYPIWFYKKDGKWIISR